MAYYPNTVALVQTGRSYCQMETGGDRRIGKLSVRHAMLKKGTSLLEFLIYLLSWTALLGLTGSQLLFFKSTTTELLRSTERIVSQSVALHLLADDLKKADSVKLESGVVILSREGKIYRWFLKGTRLIRSCSRGTTHSSSVIADTVTSFSCTKVGTRLKVTVDRLELFLPRRL